MNDFNFFGGHQTTMHANQSMGSWANRHQTILLSAIKLYERVCWHGRLFRLFAWLRQRPFQLITLDTVAQQCQISNHYHAGQQTVPLSHIRGSDERSHDFDAGFHPRQSHSRQKWLSVAMVNLSGNPLPPVDLIQVGSVYFVRDGHHRISVARALGQQEIEAAVNVWQVVGPLPWEPIKHKNVTGIELPVS